MVLKYNGTTIEKVIYNGNTMSTVVYNGETVFEYWISKTGTYASYTLHTDRNTKTVYSATFTGVKPKKIVVGGKLTTFDFNNTVTYSYALYYATSGWVTVASGSKGLSAGDSWSYSNTVTLTKDEEATRWRLIVSDRSNGNDHTAKITSWSERG